MCCSGLLAAVAWPTVLLSVANVIDNPWSVAMQRAHATGKKLAEILLAREQVLSARCSKQTTLKKKAV